LTDQQVRFAPPAQRLQQLARAEKLLTEIDATKVYPYQYVCFRITEFRPDSYADLLISGPDLENDLCRMMEHLVEKLPAVPVEEVSEPVLTLEQMSKQLNVSTKTISRWRRRGLVGRKVVCNGRSQVGFVQSIVDRFLKANEEHVARSSRFSQLSEEEKEEILRRARRLSRVSGGTLTEVSRRIAQRLGRSPETIRYTIKNFDRAHPEQALFPDVTGPLDADTKQIIYSSYRRGISVDTLAKRFRRTRTSMYRVINEVRAQRLLDQPLEYIDHPDFHDSDKETEIMELMPKWEDFEAKKREMRIPKDVPVELQSLYEMPLLNREQEAHLFRKMNFLKFKAFELREGLDPAHARIQDLKTIEELQEQAQKIKELLISCNMRLVMSIAKRHSGQTDNFFELVSDGNMSLLRAVEKFDASRGNKFSTYASWAIMKNYARSIPEEKHRRERYVTGHEELFEAAPDNRTDEQECLASAEQAASRVNRLLEYLEPREQQIIRMRAGLEGGSNPKTLEEIGLELGITKERVRQLNVRIMNKLRSIAREQHLDVP
jgi:RNA polymerase sigma factor (sigma-70 family)